MKDKVWMKPPDGGEVKEVTATPEILVPMMVAGWSQCPPPVLAPAESEDK